MSAQELIAQMCTDARAAARALAVASTDAKNKALMAMARGLEQGLEEIKAANAADLEAARAAGYPPAFIDRLTLSEAAIGAMVQGLKDVAALPDPVGEVTRMWRRPNGLVVGRRRIPLGVIGFIYESRPNVTVDAAALCLKSANAVILKGGKEAINSNLALARIIASALEEAGLPPKAVQVVPTTEREATLALVRSEALDVIIPRGGEGLIRFVAENARVPVLKHFKGVCHVYVDEGADHDMAEAICINAKCQRPGVCNAMESLLVHRVEAPTFLPRVARALMDRGVEIRGCPTTVELVAGAKAATEADWAEEYLDLILSVKVVDSMDEAIEHIARYGSRHTEAIVTSDYSRAQRFLDEVEASVVLVNASTRFNDGGQLGLGAEIGISTDKLHAFGPMGLEELTTTKFIVFGSGQVRE